MDFNKLKKAERSIYSQSGQDGVLEKIFNEIAVRNKFFVDLGSRDGLDISNTANLRINRGWEGLLIDAEPLSEIVFEHFITAENINNILSLYNVTDIDFLSIDLDGNDYYIWEAINRYPLVVSIEYNSKFRNDESYAIEYNPNHKWEGDDYYSASLLALKKLGQQKGYTLVYVVGELDAVFVRNDLLKSDYEPPTLDELLPHPIIAHNTVSNKKWIKI